MFRLVTSLGTPKLLFQNMALPNKTILTTKKARFLPSQIRHNGIQQLSKIIGLPNFWLTCWRNVCKFVHVLVCFRKLYDNNNMQVGV